MFWHSQGIFALDSEASEPSAEKSARRSFA